ncbi:hypothetical protein, partial [Cohnella sp. JJ-181]|uniref:hypothetical protein n=1 Tax=Cohnella rhizoplanae TaxID=2974897 RepID=UPI00232F33E3
AYGSSVRQMEFKELESGGHTCEAMSCRNRSLCDLKLLGVVNTGTLDEIIAERIKERNGKIL